MPCPLKILRLQQARLLRDIPGEHSRARHCPRNCATCLIPRPPRVSANPAGAYNVDLQMTVPVFERNILTFGGTYRNGWSNQTNTNLTLWRDTGSPSTLAYQSQGKDRTYGIFLQDEITILNNLTAYIGGRGDWWETYDGYANQVGTVGYPKYYDSRSASAFSPKGALVYKPFEQTAFRASAGTAFRPPTVDELYATTTSAGTQACTGPSSCAVMPVNLSIGTVPLRDNAANSGDGAKRRRGITCSLRKPRHNSSEGWRRDGSSVERRPHCCYH